MPGEESVLILKSGLLSLAFVPDLWKNISIVDDMDRE